MVNLTEYLESVMPETAHYTIPAIVGHITAHYVHDDEFLEIYEAEVKGAHDPMTEVEEYGLHILLDANGNAATVRFPHGAIV